MTKAIIFFIMFLEFGDKNMINDKTIQDIKKINKIVLVKMLSALFLFVLLFIIVLVFQSRKTEKIFYLLGGLVGGLFLCFFAYYLTMDYLPNNRKIKLYNRLLEIPVKHETYKIVESIGKVSYDGVRFNGYHGIINDKVYQILVDENNSLEIDKTYDLELVHQVLIRGEIKND